MGAATFLKVWHSEPLKIAPLSHLHDDPTWWASQLTVRVKTHYVSVLLQVVHSWNAQQHHGSSQHGTAKLWEWNKLGRHWAAICSLTESCRKIPNTYNTSSWQCSYLQLRRHQWLLSPERSTTACHLQVLQRFKKYFKAFPGLYCIVLWWLNYDVQVVRIN